MKPADRYAWILAYLAKRDEWSSVNVLDAYFVDCYIDECAPAKVRLQAFGAHSVPQLGRDLSALFNAGKLKRRTAGTGDMRSMGFPPWVHDYQLKENPKHAENN